MINKPITAKPSNSIIDVIRVDKRGGGGHNWGKYFIGLFNVSEHEDHFKTRKNRKLDYVMGNSL